MVYKGWTPVHSNYLCLTFTCECSCPIIQQNKKLLNNPEHGACITFKVLKRINKKFFRAKKETTWTAR
eukprot:4588856-Ditylum_brightwellii.AAC.1